MRFKISIVTINYNNYLGLKKTINSVINQSYDLIEYIVIDGGSIDGSKNLIKEFEGKIHSWISENDGGVYNAQNKGILKSTGDYILFLNSGDFLIDNEVISKAVSLISNEDILYGDLFLEYDGSELVIKNYPSKLSFNYFFQNESLPHPSSFIKRNLFNKVGLYNETYKIVSDWEFWLKSIFLHQVSYKKIPFPISAFNMHGMSSSNKNMEVTMYEKNDVFKKYFSGFIEDYILFHKIKNDFAKNNIIKILKKIRLIKFD